MLSLETSGEVTALEDLLPAEMLDLVQRGSSLASLSSGRSAQVTA